MDDEKIIELFFARDEQAIQLTDAVYGRRLFSLAHRILCNKHDSEESVSDTYMRVWTLIPPNRPSYFYAYLAKICRYFALDKFDWNNAEKRKAVIVSLTDEMGQCIPDRRSEMQLECRELGRLITQFLESISQESRLIFMRRYWFHDSIAEIAQRYGISESKVKMRLHRTRNQLAEYLNKEGISV